MENTGKTGFGGIRAGGEGSARKFSFEQVEFHITRDI